MKKLLENMLIYYKIKEFNSLVKEKYEKSKEKLSF